MCCVFGLNMFISNKVKYNLQSLKNHQTDVIWMEIKYMCPNILVGHNLLEKSKHDSTIVLKS